MEYTVSIKGESGTIRIEDVSEGGGNNGIIKLIKFDIHQTDKSAHDRSEQLFNLVRIEGLLNDKSAQNAKEILEWSKKTERDEVYRIVSIQVKLGGKLLRDYYLKDMFCVSYEEIFDEEENDTDSIGRFILEMKQRKGSINTIVVE